jgi:uncharacterized protein YbjT (DUF2867 family)
VSAGAVPFAVTGATGQIGSRVARRLSEAGTAQRLVVRDPARAPQLPGAGVAVAQYRDGDAMRRALAGADTLFLASAAESADRLTEHLTAVSAAAAAGVRRIVYLSFVGAAPEAAFTLARQHWATEQAVRATGMAYTFLRDSMYSDYLPLMTSAADRTIRGPAGDGVVGAVARDDIVEVAAAVLLAQGPSGRHGHDGHDGHDGATYDVTGPEAITLSQAAEALSAATGRPVRYHPETPSEAYQSRARYGAPDWEVDGWVSSYLAIAAGELAVVTDTVPRLTGHPAVSFPELLRRRPEVFGHLL